jgi:hypothetical protein
MSLIRKDLRIHIARLYYICIITLNTITPLTDHRHWNGGRVSPNPAYDVY